MARRLPLPPNASALEIALSAALALPDDLLNLHELLSERLRNPTDEDLPFLVWEWGLQPVLPFLDNPRRALAEGRRWQKIRGTIPAGHVARSWIDAYATHEQEHSKRYHLHLGNGATEGELEGIITLSRLSQSLRSKLYRVTWQLDHRALIKGRGKRTTSIRGNPSGIRFRPDWPLISFMEKVDLVGRLDTQISGAITIGIGGATRRHSDIVRARSIRPAKAALAHPSQITVTYDLGRGAFAWGTPDLEISVRPVAGVIRAVSKRGALQSVRGAYRIETARSFKRGKAKRPFGDAPKSHRLSAVPEPYRIGGKVSLAARAHGDVAVSVGAHVTVPQSPSLLHIEHHIGGLADLDNAPWSGLPPGPQEFGSSPSTLLDLKPS